MCPLVDQQPSKRPHPALHVALWTGQALLAAGFFMMGAFKTTRSIATLASTMIWPGAVPAPLVRAIGVAELLGAAGLVLPALTRRAPILTPVAAAALALLMVLASFFHFSRGELELVPVTLVLAAAAAFIAWGRLARAPIEARA
jgi:hypothetical protein